MVPQVREGKAGHFRWTAQLCGFTGPGLDCHRCVRVRVWAGGKNGRVLTPVTDWRPGTAASKENLLPRLNPDFRAVMNHFVYSMMNGLLGYPLLESIDYRSGLIEEGSAAEQAIAIFCNVLELDADGSPVNANEAEIRAAQYIRAYCDSTYEVDPPFEDWEIDRPWRKGKRLGPMP